MRYNKWPVDQGTKRGLKSIGKDYRDFSWIGLLEFNGLNPELWLINALWDITEKQVRVPYIEGRKRNTDTTRDTNTQHQIARIYKDQSENGHAPFKNIRHTCSAVTRDPFLVLIFWLHSKTSILCTGRCALKIFRNQDWIKHTLSTNLHGWFSYLLRLSKLLVFHCRLVAKSKKWDERIWRTYAA